MQKKILIIVVLTAFLCSGLAHSSPQNASRVLSFIASLYMPADGSRTTGLMTFGNDLRELPDRTIFK